MHVALADSSVNHYYLSILRLPHSFIYRLGDIHVASIVFLLKTKQQKCILIRVSLSP